MTTGRINQVTTVTAAPGRPKAPGVAPRARGRSRRPQGWGFSRHAPSVRRPGRRDPRRRWAGGAAGRGFFPLFPRLTGNSKVGPRQASRSEGGNPTARHSAAYDPRGGDAQRRRSRPARSRGVGGYGGGLTPDSGFMECWPSAISPRPPAKRPPGRSSRRALTGGKLWLDWRRFGDPPVRRNAAAPRND